jgi:hypothetical protein
VAKDSDEDGGQRRSVVLQHSTQISNPVQFTVQVAGLVHVKLCVLRPHQVLFSITAIFPQRQHRFPLQPEDLARLPASKSIYNTDRPAEEVEAANGWSDAAEAQQGSTDLTTMKQHAAQAADEQSISLQELTVTQFRDWVLCHKESAGVHKLWIPQRSNKLDHNSIQRAFEYKWSQAVQGRSSVTVLDTAGCQHELCISPYGPGQQAGSKDSAKDNERGARSYTKDLRSFNLSVWVRGLEKQCKVHDAGV